jgi:hypothetical protein
VYGPFLFALAFISPVGKSSRGHDLLATVATTRHGWRSHLFQSNSSEEFNTNSRNSIHSTTNLYWSRLVSSLSILPLTILPLPFLELKEFHQLVKYFKHQSQAADLFPSIQFPLKEVNDLKYFQDIFQDLSVVIKKSSNWKQHEQEIISALSIVNHVSSFPPFPPD